MLRSRCAVPASYAGTSVSSRPRSRSISSWVSRTSRASGARARAAAARGATALHRSGPPPGARWSRCAAASSVIAAAARTPRARVASSASKACRSTAYAYRRRAAGSAPRTHRLPRPPPRALRFPRLACAYSSRSGPVRKPLVFPQGGKTTPEKTHSAHAEAAQWSHGVKGERGRAGPSVPSVREGRNGGCGRTGAERPAVATTEATAPGASAGSVSRRASRSRRIRSSPASRRARRPPPRRCARGAPACSRRDRTRRSPRRP